MLGTIFLGIATPTEAFGALAAGAHGLKLFPAEAASPAVLKALRDNPSHRDIPVMFVTAIDENENEDENENDDEDDEDPNAMVQVPMTDGSTRMITRAQLAALQAAQAQKAPPGPPPQIQPPPPPQLAGPQWAADPGMDPAMAVAMGQTTQFYPQHSMGQTLQPAAPGSMYPVQAQQGFGGPVQGYQPPQQPQFQAPPPPAPYDLGAMRQACVRFVEQLEVIPPDGWQAEIGRASCRERVSSPV